MKSAAFNLAFKVHRNEIPFADGLLKAVDAQAQEDFIEALNSLAGSSKYSLDQLDFLIERARKGLTDDRGQSEEARKKLEEEIQVLKKDLRELQEGKGLLEAQNKCLVPTIVPGINSILVFMLGIVMTLIVFAAGFAIVALFFLVLALLGAAGAFMFDMNQLNAQRESLTKKKEANNKQIARIQEQIAGVNKKIVEKQGKLSKKFPKSEPDEGEAPEVDMPPM